MLSIHNQSLMLLSMCKGSFRLCCRAEKHRSLPDVTAADQVGVTRVCTCRGAGWRGRSAGNIWRTGAQRPQHQAGAYWAQSARAGSTDSSNPAPGIFSHSFPSASYFFFFFPCKISAVPRAHTPRTPGGGHLGRVRPRTGSFASFLPDMRCLLILGW